MAGRHCLLFLLLKKDNIALDETLFFRKSSYILENLIISGRQEENINCKYLHGNLPPIISFLKHIQVL